MLVTSRVGETLGAGSLKGTAWLLGRVSRKQERHRFQNCDGIEPLADGQCFEGMNPRLPTGVYPVGQEPSGM